MVDVEAERGGECEDDVYRDCRRRAEAGACTGEAGSEDPYHEARLALAECRQSCREVMRDKYSQSDLPAIVQLYGGVQVERYRTYLNLDQTDQLKIGFRHGRFRIQISSL